MHDLKTTYPVTQADIERLQWVDVSPPSMDIYIRDEVRQITGVYFDTVAADSWAVLSPTRIRVLMPVPVFRRVIVYAEPYSLDKAGVKVALAENRYVSGPERLLQIISRMWLTEHGSIMDNVGLGTLISQSDLNDVGTEGIAYLVSERIVALEEAIKYVQKSQRRLQDNETLLRLEIVTVLVIPGATAVSVYMRAITKAGNLLVHLSTEV